MYLMSLIGRILLAIAAITLVSCRISVTPVISVTDLWDTSVRTVPVTISTEARTCNKGVLDGVVREFSSFHKLTPLGCFEEGSKSLKPYWETTIPLLRKGDEGKIPYLSASIYYSKNNSIIVTFNTAFYDKIRKHALDQGFGSEANIDLDFQILNNTDMPVRLATQGVFVNGNSSGNDMNIYEIRPGGKIWVRLSDVGVNSLLVEGIEPVGVLPARER